MAKSQLVLAFLVVLCASYVTSHSYVTSPTSRSNQKQTETGCRGPACLGPCDAAASRASSNPTSIARGASINVQWPRNNHAGGFIRFAWAQTSGSDVHANFDNAVQEIHCHEVGGCGPDNKNDPNGGDSGPADGSSRACQITLTVPLYLTDGAWTLQWAWFGGAFSLGDYYSCVDYKISGGPVGAQLAPVYYGGDYTYPGQNKCKFFNTDRLHRCVNEPCNNPVYTLSQEQSGPAYMVNSSQPSVVTTKAPSPVTTAATKVITTKAATPVTTKSSTPATTAKTTPSTTKANQAQTTGKQPLTTSRIINTLTSTGSSSSGSSGTSSGNIGGTAINCAGLTSVVSSTVLTITDVDSWSNVFRVAIEMDINEDVSNWMLQIIFPSDAFDTTITDVFNAGVLKCSSNSPTRHSMLAPASWATDLKAGEQVFLEFKAINTNMDNDFIRNNIQLVMFRS